MKITHSLTLCKIFLPTLEEQVNFIDHSIYYNDQDFKECVSRTKGALRMLNLNCGG